MSILDKIEVVCGDIREVAADLLVLKYADGLYGADSAVAGSINVNIHVPEGAAQSYPGRNIAADTVLFIGVGPLFDFRYIEIRNFARDMLDTVQDKHADARTVSTTIHGPGYGLDEREAFESQLSGYLDYAKENPTDVNKLLIVERDAQRAARLDKILQDMRADQAPPLKAHQNSAFNKLADHTGVANCLPPDTHARPFFGQFIDHDLSRDHIKAPATPPERTEKPKLFAAMPFAEKYMDEYDIAFVEAAHAHGFLCERLDLESYVGDIIDEIFKRIRNSSAVIALLNDNNPNVFLEVGYAMALDKPVILIAHKDQDIAFDLRSQRRQTYGRIAELRKSLTGLIGDLKADGTLA